MTKKTMITMGLIMLLIFTLTGCVTIVEKEVDETDFINPVTLDEVIKKVENKESFNFILGNDGCPACTIYLEELQVFHKKEKYKFDYMRYSAETDKEVFVKFATEVLGEKMENLATPTTYFIVDGVVADRVVGAIKTDKIKTYSEYYK